MKTMSTRTMLAVAAATLGLSAIAPAMAQPAPPAPGIEAPQPDGGAVRPGHGGLQRPGGFGGVFDLERGAEAIEIAVVRLNHRLDLSAEQQTLLDTLKTDALAAAEGFANATETLRPTSASDDEAPARSDFAEALDTRIALDTARLDALKAIQPAATAFFDSLTDDQKAQMTPQSGDRFGPGKRGGEHPGGPRHQRPDHRG